MLKKDTKIRTGYKAVRIIEKSVRKQEDGYYKGWSYSSWNTLTANNSSCMLYEINRKTAPEYNIQGDICIFRTFKQALKGCFLNYALDYKCFTILKF